MFVAILVQAILTKSEQSLASRHLGMPADNCLAAPSAIAKSPCQSQSSLVSPEALPLPSLSSVAFCPHPHLMPPVEQGERCHVCDQPAWGFTNHICWCKACALALLPIRNVFALMVVPKHALTTHAHLYANRWTGIVLKLIAHVLPRSLFIHNLCVLRP